MALNKCFITASYLAARYPQEEWAEPLKDTVLLAGNPTTIRPISAGSQESRGAGVGDPAGQPGHRGGGKQGDSRSCCPCAKRQRRGCEGAALADDHTYPYEATEALLPRAKQASSAARLLIQQLQEVFDVIGAGPQLLTLPQEETAQDESNN